MKKAYIKKVLKLLLMLFIITLIISPIVKANEVKNLEFENEGKEIVRLASGDFSGLEGIYGKNDDTFKAIGSKVLGVVVFMCYAAAIIVLVVKGVQFMNKAPDAKAEIKKELVSAAIGAGILAGSGLIVQIISNIAIGPLFG